MSTSLAAGRKHYGATRRVAVGTIGNRIASKVRPLRARRHTSCCTCGGGACGSLPNLPEQSRAEADPQEDLHLAGRLPAPALLCFCKLGGGPLCRSTWQAGHRGCDRIAWSSVRVVSCLCLRAWALCAQSLWGLGQPRAFGDASNATYFVLALGGEHLFHVWQASDARATHPPHPPSNHLGATGSLLQRVARSRGPPRRAECCLCGCGRGASLQRLHNELISSDRLSIAGLRSASPEALGRPCALGMCGQHARRLHSTDIGELPWASDSHAPLGETFLC